MRIAPSRSRILRGGTAAVAAAALGALGAVPALAADPEPDLGVGTIAPVKGLQPESSFSTPLTFLNKGEAEVPEVWVTYAVSPGLKADETYKNCTYYTVTSHDEMPASNVASCKIGQPLKPGVVYGTAKPVSLKALDSAFRDDLRVTVGVDEPGPGDGGSTEPVPGTGDPLTLVEKGPASDADRTNHPEPYAGADVTAANTADFALTGDERKGKVGAEVTATVKFANKGPARVQGARDRSVTTVDIRIPEGTSVVKPHGFCDAVTRTHYRCGTSQSWVDVNGGESYPFVLRVDKAVGRTTGEVSFTGQERPFDRNAENDTAQIVIDTGKDEDTSGSSGGTGGSSSTGGSGTAGSTGTTGSTGSTGSSGGSAGTGGSTTGGATPQTGGNLAATGSDSTGPLIGMAAAAVAAGGGILWAVRRRSAAHGS
ncbi:LAETG motif-containing sortase-dependent surface protein [Streptomyces globisporus]|uniref:LAETG motif-containing sortase-dependent surface protein n=1 Tax=Streptomyces TaxID=1883 RepID=UPI0029BC03D8|nr:MULTISPECIES: LAETG motif-containing sortase-dependent surface protein [unclassified Streptomyces]MDX3607719.1 LAETG motif-containing sortase-dependent surface protein [Streptomyces sp. FL06-04B]MDX3739408.1 LAETG motif-containing sortase-dependent surface protein [Streptomyces sp. ID01-15D]